MTVVNGPSTYVSLLHCCYLEYLPSRNANFMFRKAAWRVHDGSSTYGEQCGVTSDVDTFDCQVTYLGAMQSGTGADRQSTTFLETTTNIYGVENRTWVSIPVSITDGPELTSTPTAPPGEQEAVASDICPIKQTAATTSLNAEEMR